MTAKGLTKLIEECGELMQVAGKKLAYYRTDTHPDGAGSLAQRLQNEAADVQAAIQLVSKTYGFDRVEFDARVAKKLALFERWHADQHNNADGIDAERLT